MKWSDSLLIGYEQFDCEHKTLFVIINTLQTMVLGDKDAKNLKHNLQMLFNFTNHHFGGEECLMDFINYPMIKDHIAEHSIFVSRLNDVSKSSRLAETNIQIDHLDFFSQWLLDHIPKADMEMVRYVKEIKRNK